jgi:hypothetical protein
MPFPYFRAPRKAQESTSSAQIVARLAAGGKKIRLQFYQRNSPIRRATLFNASQRHSLPLRIQTAAVQNHFVPIQMDSFAPAFECDAGGDRYQDVKVKEY